MAGCSVARSYFSSSSWAMSQWLQQYKKYQVMKRPCDTIARPQGCRVPTRTISRAHALELTPQQKETLDSIYERFVSWCETLQIKMVDVQELMAPKIPLDPAI